jgi:hypothetical protein
MSNPTLTAAEFRTQFAGQSVPKKKGCKPAFPSEEKAHLAKQRHFLHLLHKAGLPAPIPEFQFNPGRKHRFDFAWPSHWLAIEIDGGKYIQGRHHTAQGKASDDLKKNHAQLMGWTVLVFDYDNLLSPSTINEIKSILLP